jgi:hypothetical protein
VIAHQLTVSHRMAVLVMLSAFRSRASRYCLDEAWFALCPGHTLVVLRTPSRGRLKGLTVMDGLSINVAEAIKQHYPTLRSLMDAYHDPSTTVRTQKSLAGVGSA